MVKENNQKGERRKVPEKKERLLRDLVELIKKSRSIVVSSVKGIPSLQVQKLRKMLEEKAILKVVKKSLSRKALKEACKEKKGVEKLEHSIGESCCMVFSSLDPFELAAIFGKNRVKVKAKPGQIAPEDIKLDAGPTDIPAGPMISELSAAGVKVAVEDGKISIKEPCVLVRKGEEINPAAAEILAKLEIMPFTVGLEVIAAYDSVTGKVYENIFISPEHETENLKKALTCAIALATTLAYPTCETIKHLLQTAEANAISLQQAVDTR